MRQRVIERRMFANNIGKSLLEYAERGERGSLMRRLNVAKINYKNNESNNLISHLERIFVDKRR